MVKSISRMVAKKQDSFLFLEKQDGEEQECLLCYSPCTQSPCAKSPHTQSPCKESTYTESTNTESMYIESMYKESTYKESMCKELDMNNSSDSSQETSNIRCLHK